MERPTEPAPETQAPDLLVHQRTISRWSRSACDVAEKVMANESRIKLALPNIEVGLSEFCGKVGLGIEKDDRVICRGSHGSQGTINIATFSLEELQNFTSDFTERNFLKSGGFGRVYKGIIRNLPDNELNGKKIVIKVSHGGNPSFRLQWEAEIRYLSYVSHRNILPLLGQCEANGKFYLVYPYMHRGNVKQNLPGLKWERTLDILIGASSALAEVHRHSLVFRDFKSANILLDHDWTPMLSDFGTVTPEGVVYASGTGGYTDPAIFLRRIPGTIQSDIFSLGILILQLITRREELGMALKDKAIEDVSLKMHAMEDSLRVLGGCPIEVARDISKLAIKCVDDDFQARPSALEVHQALAAYKADRRDKFKTAMKMIPKMCIGVPKTED